MPLISVEEKTDKIMKKEFRLKQKAENLLIEQRMFYEIKRREGRKISIISAKYEQYQKF